MYYTPEEKQAAHDKVLELVYDETKGDINLPVVLKDVARQAGVPDSAIPKLVGEMNGDIATGPSRPRVGETILLTQQGKRKVEAKQQKLSD